MIYIKHFSISVYLGQSWSIFVYFNLFLFISVYLGSSHTLTVYNKLSLLYLAISSHCWLSLAVFGYIWLSLSGCKKKQERAICCFLKLFFFTHEQVLEKLGLLKMSIRFLLNPFYLLLIFVSLSYHLTLCDLLEGSKGPKFWPRYEGLNKGIFQIFWQKFVIKDFSIFFLAQEQ